MNPLEISIEVAQLSDPGRDPNKQINEDSCGYAQTKHGHLCVLCDGMGGHYGGQEASRRAITTIFAQIERAAEGTPPGLALKNAIAEAARNVYELGGPLENKVRPGSTVVAMLVHNGGLEVAHVGDSRAYVIRSGQIYPLTRDHSMVQAMIDAGFLSEEQAIGHPDANKITRALGMKPDVDVEVRPETMELFPGDLLLTTSDGLTDLALAKDILGATRQALASGGLDHAALQLVRMANDRGGHDNITVQLVKVLAVGAQKTRSGATQADGPQTTVSDAQTQPVLGTASAAREQLADTAGPTSVDASRAHAGTIPMQPAATFHDGTSPDSYAAGRQPHAQGRGFSGMGVAVSPTLAQPPSEGASHPFDPNAGYPVSVRFDMNPHAGQAFPGAGPANVPNYGPPSGAFAPNLGPGANARIQGQASGVDSSAARRTSGGVLFLALAISFVVAVVALALLWLLLLR